MNETLRPTADSAWLLEESGHDPLRESSTESRFAVSNGFLGVRGSRAISRGARWATPSRTYVAGLFDAPGADDGVPALVPAADWLRIDLSAHGAPLVHHPGDLSSHRLTLDLRRGMVLSDCLLDAPGARFRFRTARFVSLSARALGVQLLELENQDGDVEVTLDASFEGLKLGLVPEWQEHDLAVWRTWRSGKRLAMAVACSLTVDGRELPPTGIGTFQWSWTWRSRPGQVARFERLVALARGDAADGDPTGVALDARAAARRSGIPQVVVAHEAAWARRWACSDIEIDGDDDAQRALRFAIYHLNSAANPADERVSIGARALTGDGYLGHVFWDTEIFMLPFYIFTWPEAARTLLMYRFHTLPGARGKAAAMGFRGAMYAWESADSGAEATPARTIAPDRQVIDVLCGTLEQHITADVAYAVWHYWQATGDDEFLLDAGAEILLETARFWSSRALLEADGQYHIRDVIGPDEYHEHVDDNAFTNVMARWTIRRGLDTASLLRQRWPARWASLAARLALDDGELGRWHAVAEQMAACRAAGSGLIEQFEGFFGLEDIDLAGYAGRSVPMDIVLGRERTKQSQVVKQADVVALLALLPEEFTAEAKVANYRYYEPRCGHGSSLSPAMHGLVAARLGDTAQALAYFHRAAAIDLAGTHAAIADGVHIAALGGVWQVAVHGFAGLSLRGDALALDPRMPDHWRSIALRVHWRGRRLWIRIGQPGDPIVATLELGEPMTLMIRGQSYRLDQETPLQVVPDTQTGLNSA